MTLTGSVATAFAKHRLSLIRFNLFGGMIGDAQINPDDPVDPFL